MSQVNSSMNFLPEDYVQNRQAARAAVVFIGLLLIVVGSIVGAYVFSQWRADGVFKHQDRVNVEFEAARKTIDEANELDKKKAQMVANAEIVSTLMERVRRSSLLAELVRLAPKSVAFVSFDLKSRELQGAPGQNKPNDAERARRQAEGLPPEAARAPALEVTLNLVGTAKSDGEVAQYIAALSKSPMLVDVNMLFSEEFKKGNDENAEKLRKFHVEMKVNPEFNLSSLSSALETTPK